MKLFASNDGSIQMLKTDETESKASYDFIPIRGILEPSQELAMANKVCTYDKRFEEIMTLRTELLLRRQPDEGAYMMAILSPCKGEGRSRLAAELALALARMNRPTLLIDADFRSPKQHHLFSADNIEGLSNLVVSDETPNLYGVKDLPKMLVMTTGKNPGNPLELLSSDNFSSLIEYMRENFEFVIIDTPPISKYSDGLVIANLVRNVLTITRSTRTSYRQMREMLRRLSTTSAQIVGGIINHF